MKRLFAATFVCAGTAVAGAWARDFSAQGRIEGVAPPARLAFTLAGAIENVLVKPGDKVRRGQKVASLVCSDRQAHVSLARAELAAAQAAHERLRNGARREERTVASARLEIAEAEEKAAQNRLRRTARLHEKGNFVSEADYEQSRDVALVTERRRAASAAELALVTAALRPDDDRAAKAQVDAAAARLAASQAELDKCTLRAPYDATVLRVFLEPGDTFLPPQGSPVMSLSHGEPVHVRVQVDERDVSRLRIGQKVTVSSSFDPNLRMEGTVLQVEGEMGRRSIVGVDPGEKNDRDVLEAIVRLKGPVPPLPVGLRVVATFRGGE